MTTVAIDTGPLDALPEHATGARAPAWWGMICLCATEAMLFACFIASYFFLRGSFAASFEDGGTGPALALPLVMTALLLLSSGAWIWGERGIRRGEQGRLRIGLALAFLLGAAFLVLQGIEYSREAYGPTRNAYYSIFYTTTAFHGAHVMLGLLMNAWVQARAWLGHFGPRRHLAVQNAGLYWHFVDVVWLVILASLYIAPRYW